MGNIIENEKNLFNLLKKDLSNDYIRIDKSFIPKSYSNNLNRFFIEENSFWFSRLKIKDGNSIYYFGFDNSDVNNLKPNLILSCNKKSPIKFIKNKVAILTRFKNHDYSLVKSLSKYFSIRTNEKLKEKDLYFLILGETSNEIFDNLKLIIEHLDYDLNYESNFLQINDSIEFKKDIVDEPRISIDSSLNTLNRNLQIIKIKNFLKNNSFNPIFVEEILQFLFVVDENLDYNLNKNTFNKNIPFEDNIFIINNLLENNDEYLILDLEKSLDIFKRRLKNKLNRYFNNIKKPNSFKSYNEIFSQEIMEKDIEFSENISDEKLYYNKNSDKNINLNDTQTELYEGYLSLRNSPKIKFHLIPSLGVSQENLVDIFKNIKLDIFNEIITEEDDRNTVFEEYVKKYLSENKSKELFGYFNKFILSEYFKELVREYENLNDEDINDIKNKVKSDIESNNLTESDIKSRFEIYFSKKSLELIYIDLLVDEFEKRREYNDSGLEISEIQEIFDDIKIDINNWHENLSIFDTSLKEIIDYKISNKQREIRSETRQEFEKLFPNKKSIKEVLNRVIFKQQDYDKLKDYIYEDIYDLKIRKEHVNKELIFSYIRFIE